MRADVAGWASRLDERIRGRGLDLSDIFLIPFDFTTMAPNHPETAGRRRGAQLFREMLELAARLRAPGMTTLPDVDWPHERHDQSLARAAAELGTRVEEARERDIRLSIEPHVGSVCGTPADTARLCELAPGLELTLDYTHSVSAAFRETDADPLLAHKIRPGTVFPKDDFLPHTSKANARTRRGIAFRRCSPSSCFPSMPRRA